MFRLLSIKRLDTGETFEDDADVLIMARGLFSEPKWPKIPGLDDFKGEIMHSGAWNKEYVSETHATRARLWSHILISQQLRFPQ